MKQFSLKRRLTLAASLIAIAGLTSRGIWKEILPGSAPRHFHKGAAPTRISAEPVTSTEGADPDHGYSAIPRSNRAESKASVRGNSPSKMERAGAASRNDSREKRPLDRLEISASLTEEWPSGFPVAPGWHPRVRIVQTTFKSGLLRIDEQVQVQTGANGLQEIQSFIVKAADARHILVSSADKPKLDELGMTTRPGGNSNYLRVPVADPLQISSIPQILRKLGKMGITGAEADSVVEASALPGDPLVGSGVTWHLDNLGLHPGQRTNADINAVAGWDFQTDASGVLVAVIDTGISTSDPELAPSAYIFPGETLGDGIDNDGNGYADDALGYDFVASDTNPEDENGHGSQCAALIGAAGNNGVGSSGVAWKASILNCRILDHNGLGTVSDAIDAIDYARTSGAKILNLSWSYFGDAPLMEEALQRCETGGTIVVCSSGNAGFASPVPAPASIDLPNMLTVAASTAEDRITAFSVVDPTKVDLAAPGEDLPVSLGSHAWNPGGGVRYVSGTSFSTAVVSGALALGKAKFPLLTPGQLLRRMTDTVDPLPGAAASVATGGRLNLGRFLSPDATAVPNDAFASRRLLTDTAGQWTGGNEGATSEAIDQTLGITPVPTRSLWFEWTAAFDGILLIDAISSDGHPIDLAVFSASGNLPQSVLARAHQGGLLQLTVMAGQKTFWMIDSTQPIPQGIRLSWKLPPPNDNWAAATAISDARVLVSGNSLGATVETLETSQLHHAYVPQGSVWWKWTAPFTGPAKAEVGTDHTVFVIPVANNSPSFPPEYVSGIRNVYDFQAVAGESYAVLVIPTTPAAAGPFTLSVSGAENFAILSQPRSIQTLSGESVTLGVKVIGYPFPQYQWYKDGEAIPFATSSTLKLSPVNEASFGNYHVAISHAGTTLTSEVAEISRRHAVPRLVGNSPRKSVLTGQPFTLDATFRSSSEISYTWKKNGTPIVGAESSSYFVPSAIANDTGTYTLAATNDAGSTTAVFQVDVIQTPWSGWVNRTPGTSKNAGIIAVSLEGNIANAFSSSEWFRSTDGGQTWASKRMPAPFRIDTAAAAPDGTGLFSGYSYDTLYGAATHVWRYQPSSGWQRVDPLLEVGGGAPAAAIRLRSLHHFDGQWWAICVAEDALSGRAIHSVDGITWSGIPQAGSPTGFMRADTLVRFENRLAIHHWTSGSDQAVMLRQPGGQSRILNFTGDTRSTMKIGDSIYTDFRYTGRQKITGDQANPVTLPQSWSPGFQGSAEAVLDGNFYVGLDSTGMISGIHEKTFTRRTMGFTSFAKSGDRWLAGYPDGQLWSGTDLEEMPAAAKDRQAMNPVLSTFEDEFVFGNYHSSDGARWQLAGEVSATGIKALAQGDGFLHAIKPSANGAVTNLMVDSLYPRAEGSTESVSGTKYWPGADKVLTYLNNVSGFGGMKFLRLVSRQPVGIQVADVDLGVTWSSIVSAREVSGRWFLEGRGPNPPAAPFFKTSTDGLSWQTLSIPTASVTFASGKFLAIENSARGYTSTNGTSWTPITMTGLPTLGTPRPDDLVSYRNHFAARYQNVIYFSADGVTWSTGSPPAGISKMEANRHTLLAVSLNNDVFQPGGEALSGPWIVMPETHQEVSVARNQSFVFKVDAGDSDGDLQSVDFLINGEIVRTLTAPPFEFHADTSDAGVQALEFVARDSQGRTSRVTSKCTVIGIGVASSSAVTLTDDLTSATLFRGNYYLIRNGTVFVWAGGALWRPTTSPFFTATKLIANSQAIVASVGSGIIVSSDGINWTHFGNFGEMTLTLREDMLEGYVSTNSMKWESSDGFDWIPATGPFHGGPPTSTPPAWVDELFGYKPDGSVTYNGGKDWIPLGSWSGGSIRSVVTVNNGFLIQSDQGIFRLLRGETNYTQIHSDTTWPLSFSLQKLEGVVYISQTGTLLRSTTDGLNFTHHTPPPNAFAMKLASFQGQWIACSPDRIAISPDLQTWTTLRTFGPNAQYATTTMTTIGTDTLKFQSTRDYNYDFILGPDLVLQMVPRAPDPTMAEIQTPYGSAGGMTFKGHHLSMSPWFHTKPLDSDEWANAPLYPSPGFTQPVPHPWPTHFVDRYQPHSARLPFAATADRFIVLRKDAFNVPLNYVITSDDGITFQIHHWNGPVPLPDVIRLAASPSGFIAAATQGRILKSTDGLSWTVHSVDPNLSISGLLHFNGKWHLSGRRTIPATPSGKTLQGEIWSSADGTAWTNSAVITQENLNPSELDTTAFIAHGKARMHASSIGWIESTDGITWQRDPVSLITTGRPILEGAAPEGLFAWGTSYTGNNTFVIVDAATYQPIRTIATGNATVRWHNGWPFLSSEGQLSEWHEEDPRLTAVEVDPGIHGVGDLIEVSVSAHDVSENQSLTLHLTTDALVGNEDDVHLGIFKWSDGENISTNTKSFVIPIPPSVTAGNFRVAAKLVTAGRDSAIQNNQIVSSSQPIEIPGYHLRLSTSGDGTVDTTDPRVIYPKGAHVQLQALAGSGHRFEGWAGSLVSTQSNISILMNSDKNLTVTFTPGQVVVLRTIGHGSVKGAAAINHLSPGETLNLTQTPAAGWVADGWSVNGVRLTGTTLNLTPSESLIVESRFIPDFHSRRNTAFSSAPIGIDRSWNADPDGDGLTNWQEILLASDPLKRKSMGESMERRTDCLRLVFTRPQSATTDPWAATEFSIDLKSWSPADSVRMTERILSVADGWETVEITMPFKEGRQGYFRLKTPEAP